jgi:hypothetical protein
MGVCKKGELLVTGHESPWFLPEITARSPECRRNKDHARGAEDRNARTWTNTEGRCRPVARGKTRTRGPLCGGRHAPGATRIRTAELAAHAGSIRVQSCISHRWTARRDLLSHLCRDGCALWPRIPWAGAPLLQHPPFPQVWRGPPNRAPCIPVIQTDGSIPMHECRPLSAPGCLHIRLRIPPSLSWRNIRACHQPARPTRAFSRGSPVSMHRLARGQPSPSICSRNPERPIAARRESPF